MASSEDEMRMRIIEATRRLVAFVDFDRLSVRAICTEAGISRPTFYNYFGDKYEVVQWHWDRINADALAQVGRTLTWEEANLRSIRNTYEWIDLYSNAFKNPRGYRNITAYGCRRMREWVLGALMEKCPDKVDDKILFELGFYTHGAADIFSTLGRGVLRSPEQFAEFVDACVPRDLLELINSGVSR